MCHSCQKANAILGCVGVILLLPVIVLSQEVIALYAALEYTELPSVTMDPIIQKGTGNCAEKNERVKRLETQFYKK